VGDRKPPMLLLVSDEVAVEAPLDEPPLAHEVLLVLDESPAPPGTEVLLTDAAPVVVPPPAANAAATKAPSCCSAVAEWPFPLPACNWAAPKALPFAAAEEAKAAASRADVAAGNCADVMNPLVGVADVKLAAQRDSNNSVPSAEVGVTQEALNAEKNGSEGKAAGGGLLAVAGQSSSLCFHAKYLFMWQWNVLGNIRFQQHPIGICVVVSVGGGTTKRWSKLGNILVTFSFFSAIRCCHSLPFGEICVDGKTKGHLK
jgi:hypothetical protein